MYAVVKLPEASDCPANASTDFSVGRAYMTETTDNVLLQQSDDANCVSDPTAATWVDVAEAGLEAVSMANDPDAFALGYKTRTILGAPAARCLRVTRKTTSQTYFPQGTLLAVAVGMMSPPGDLGRRHLRRRGRGV